MTPEQRTQLIAAADMMRSKSYAPYSKFAVGAAIMDEHGDIHQGCNVENAAYPQGQCAEATAIGVMIAAGGTKIRAIAIAGPRGTSCPPCGGCRQRIREFADQETEIILGDEDGLLEKHSADELLPNSFGPNNLD